MKIYLDCMPCFLRQVLEASRIATDDVELQKKILIEGAKIVTQVDNYKSSPEVGREIHYLIKKHTGIDDPYRELKRLHIEAANKLYPEMKQFLYRQKDRLESALKIAAAGNVIDAAISNSIDIKRDIIEEFSKEFSMCDIKKFREDIENGKTLLIIGDNAGETVFDRILAEELLHLDITYAVRSAPIINDATVEEAYESGLDYCTRIISTGCDVPGTILDECSDGFIDIYKNADVVISKGQGNYETLSDEKRGIFFLLKAKCPVIAKDIGVDINDYVFTYR